NWMATLIRARKESSPIGTGTFSPVETGSDAVLALRHDNEGLVSVITMTNLSGKEQKVTLELTEDEATRSTDLFEDTSYPPVKGAKTTFTLSPYGYRWIRIAGVY
ncbi:MAG TPA: alpha-glucosidase C-terminal domain-containing protein, partial [Thermomicrobiales bacterium]|nr:alpha-glucosidase C-terminal domain-containing protein [Thermomicrobiales bacterium]